MKHRWRTALKIVKLAIACWVLSTSASLATPPRVTKLTVGLSGAYQAGRWTEVQATLVAESDFRGEVFLDSVDGDGTPYRTPAADGAIQITAGATQVVTFSFRPAALDSPLAITFVSGDGENQSEAFSYTDDREELRIPAALPANMRLMVSVGPALGAAEAFGTADVEGEKTTSVELSSFQDLPSRALGFDAIDTLLLSTSSPELHEALSAQPERWNALLEWLRLGGRLVLPIGREAPRVFAENHPLARLFPGAYRGEATLLESQTLAWEQYALARQPLPLVINDEGAQRLRVPNVADFRGKVEAPPNPSPGQPALVARAPYGFGEIVFVAADLDQPPFAKWSGRSNLLRRLTRSRIRNDAPTSARAEARVVTDRDLVSQLREGLDAFSGVRLASFVWVALLVLGYVALIGPADFRLQRWWLRAERTWLTFPLVVLLTSFGVYQLAASLKGRELRINQVDVVDVDPTGLVRGTTVANIFSPSMVTYDLGLSPAVGEIRPREVEVRMSGFALAPSSLTGESERASIAALSADSYQYAPQLDHLQALPLNIWSSKAVSARWRGQIEPPVRASLHAAPNQQVEGTIALQQDLQLEDCWLVYADSVARLTDVIPGAEIQVGSRADVTWSTLGTQLRYPRQKQKVPGREDYGTVGTQWDAESTEIPEILRQVIFYDAAGGNTYTRSWNGALRQLDLSDRRDLGQAMLVAFVKPAAGKSPCATLLNGEEPLRGAKDQHYAVLRCFLSVEPARAAP